ncbi:MAG: fibrillarin-like rRNA/tRNA 2'-O-methyltransferase [Candidatus Thermoplasmatota archaeon]|nr:fibrillarin-like rRNA/tRNA 2'-O-methyltransferase [Candidatus Thermoplasmatota archaeon]MBU1941274.1 fibrillarin-like rRNA/tRNA 2'-O-methyltransferase [Candidatus Thermoplasmatota archaeon]
MQQIAIPGVFKQKDKLFTLNPAPCRGMRVYNEKLVHIDDNEYRSWNPYRSKMAAALLKNISIHLASDSQVLYLGAAMGTTVSHIADIITKGTVYAVEHTPLAMHTLLDVSKYRSNIIPILEDAFHPDRYASLVPQVDLVYQDISQRNQAEIFIENARRYLKSNGIGILMVKARSIDVALPPRQAYKIVESTLKSANISIRSIDDLDPYDKDHSVFVISSPNAHKENL